MADERGGLERRLIKTIGWLVEEDGFLVDCETIRSIREAAEVIGECRRAMRAIVQYANGTWNYWNCDQDSKVGKRTAAMAGNKGYSEVTDDFHAVLAKLEGGSADGDTP